MTLIALPKVVLLANNCRF